MSYQSDKDEAYKALSKKDRAKLYRKLSEYERTTELATFHGNSMSVDEMQAFVQFAANLARHHNGVRFAGLSIRREKNWDELTETVKEKAYYRR